MHPWELVVIAVGLSMDAFAIAVCKGLSVDGLKKKHMVVTGLWFGGAQGLMPLIGYLLGTGFRAWIERLDHWIAFVLLLIIGLGMIKESRQEGRRLEKTLSTLIQRPVSFESGLSWFQPCASFESDFTFAQ